MLLTYLKLLVLLQTQIFLLLKSKSKENRERNDSRISKMTAIDSEAVNKTHLTSYLKKILTEYCYLHTKNKIFPHCKNKDD